MNHHSLLFYGNAFFGFMLARYVVVIGTKDWFFYSFLSRSIVDQTQQYGSPSRKFIQPDIKLSVLSASVFALAAAFIKSIYGLGMTRLYSQVHQHSLWYLGVSYGAALVLQDTYFYFTHHFSHHESLFPWVHQGHPSYK